MLWPHLGLDLVHGSQVGGKSPESYAGHSADGVTWGNLVNLSEPRLSHPRRKMRTRTHALVSISSGFEKTAD